MNRLIGSTQPIISLGVKPAPPQKDNFSEEKLRDLQVRIDRGILYCDKLHCQGEKCIRLIKKYNCETCDENKLQICKAWRKIIELEKSYYLLQIVQILRRHVALFKPIKKEKQSSRWSKHYMEQENLFKRR